ncbi:MAG TPA: hypothetical protein VIQ00_07390 [Chitinophagaceae bacterium]|jgi:hypothetical protein
MAKQTGIHKITGLIGETSFYQVEDKFYARSKSSLTRKRVLNDPAFTQTMKYAGLLARASKMASLIYHTLPKEQQNLAKYRKLTGEMMKLLKEEG